MKIITLHYINGATQQRTGAD